MARKLVLVLSLVAAVAVITGCKDDKPTSMNIDTKNMYQQNQKYKQSAGTAGGTATTTEP
jgi:hypothetical protein